MDTLQIEKGNALKAYGMATPEGKQLLAALFGEKVFIPENLFDKSITFSDVCAIAGVDECHFATPDGQTAEDRALTCRRKLMLVAKVYNGDWKPNVADTNQYKYYPWFRIVPDSNKSSGFGLSYLGCAYVSSGTGLGVRPYFKDGKTAAFVGQQFLAEYETLAQAESQLL
jgi:hypothetical protein